MSPLLPRYPTLQPQTVKQPPTGGHSVHEPKFYGWRLQAIKRGLPGCLLHVPL